MVVISGMVRVPQVLLSLADVLVMLELDTKVRFVLQWRLVITLHWDEVKRGDLNSSC